MGKLRSWVKETNQRPELVGDRMQTVASDVACFMDPTVHSDPPPPPLKRFDGSLTAALFLRAGSCTTTRGLLSEKHKQVVLSTNHLFSGHLGGAGQAVNTRVFYFCVLQRQIFWRPPKEVLLHPPPPSQKENHQRQNDD